MVMEVQQEAVVSDFTNQCGIYIPAFVAHRAPSPGQHPRGQRIHFDDIVLTPESALKQTQLIKVSLRLPGQEKSTECLVLSGALSGEKEGTQTQRKSGTWRKNGGMKDAKKLRQLRQIKQDRQVKRQIIIVKRIGERAGVEERKKMSRYRGTETDIMITLEADRRR